MRMLVPFMVNTDAYTATSYELESQDCKNFSCYNLTNRYNPADVFSCADDSRMVLYGLSDFINNVLLIPIIHDDIKEAKEFMKDRNSFGDDMRFNEDMYKTIVDEYEGMLPIAIESIPEGSTFFPNEPVIQVNSMLGFGQIAAMIEPLLVGMVSIGTARATLTRHLFNKLAQFTQRVHPSWTKKQVYNCVSWMVHDFGMRGSSCGEESELLGRAHLLCFNGTDSFNAAYQAWRSGAKKDTGKSILALAHRIVQGYDNEGDAYNNLFNLGETASYVADCYDFHNAVSNYLLDLAKKKEKVIVVRSDSGDYLDNILFIIKTAISAGLSSPDELGRPQGNWMKFIQSDSMDYEKIINTLTQLEKEGFDPVGWGIFGVGGWLRNSCTRDTLSTAYKLCAKGMYGTPVCKLTKGCKASIPGVTIVNNVGDGSPSVHLTRFDGLNFDSRKVYYNNTTQKYLERENFSLLQDRAIHDFDRYNLGRDYGMNFSCLSQEILDLQKELGEKYGSMGNTNTNKV